MIEEEQQLLHSTLNQDPNVITLDKVVAEMNTWRITRATSRKKIPDLIWNMVFILRETIPQARILSACRIKLAQLKMEEKKRQTPTENTQYASSKLNESGTANIKTLPRASLANQLDAQPLVIDFYRKDGSLLAKAHASNIHMPELASLLNAFLQAQ